MFRHVKCAHWGLATLQWEQEDKRCFRFEDGTERIFSTSFLHLLEPVDGPIRMELCPPVPHEIPIAFEDQVALFQQWFPGGFAGELWQADRRGNAPGRRLKRHRTPAVAQAHETLSREAIDGRLAEGKWLSVVESATDLLHSVDLATRAEVDSMRNCTASERLAITIRDALHGDDPLDRRFDKLCQQLHTAGARASSWPLVTALFALVHPIEHVCVRPGVLKAQARLLGRNQRLAPAPNSSGYTRYLELARHVRDVLCEREQAPADLLDVIDFVWLTMRPAAQADLVRLAAARVAATAPEPAEGDASAA